MTPHKHADLIIAWAGGAKIQRQIADTCNEWIDVAEPRWLPEAEFRVKPETRWVRIGLFVNMYGNTYDSQCHSSDSEKSFESREHFKRWITDRIYYE